MDIYENVVIGNFLFSLGAAIGKRSGELPTPPLAVNLLQQTPMDPMAGDVLIKGAGALRLIEFKRLKNKSTKEKSKLLKLRIALRDVSFANLEPVSRKVHWYIETENVTTNFEINIRPYLDLDQKDSQITLKKFVEGIVDDVFSKDAKNESELSRYIGLLHQLPDSEGTSSGGLIVSVTKNGEIHYAVIEDLKELLLNLEKFKSLYSERVHLQNTKHEIERHQPKEKERTLERGFGR